MYYIEQGRDLNGITIWFVLKDADLISSFYSREEAMAYIDSVN